MNSLRYLDLHWIIIHDVDLLREYPIAGTLSRTKSQAIKKYIKQNLDQLTWRQLYRFGYKCVRVEISYRRID